jgi:cytochrome d ubiquinol oxidase subunit I
MDLDPVFLSRLQFAFLISFHIIFPSFTIGLAAWLATIEGARLATGNPLYRRVFDFWLKVFAVSFGMGVVTGVVMAFQFGTNWGVLAQRAGSIQAAVRCKAPRSCWRRHSSLMLLGRDPPRTSPLPNRSGTMFLVVLVHQQQLATGVSSTPHRVFHQTGIVLES